MRRSEGHRRHGVGWRKGVWLSSFPHPHHPTAEWTNKVGSAPSQHKRSLLLPSSRTSQCGFRHHRRPTSHATLLYLHTLFLCQWVVTFSLPCLISASHFPPDRLMMSRCTWRHFLVQAHSRYSEPARVRHQCIVHRGPLSLRTDPSMTIIWNCAAMTLSTPRTTRPPRHQNPSYFSPQF